MKNNYSAACPYCGQIRSFEYAGELTETERVSYVGKKCTCEKAERERAIDRTYNDLPKVVGEQSIKQGFDYELNEDTVAQIRRLICAILDGHMDRVSFIEPNGDTIRMIKAPDRIKISRISKKQLTI